MCGIAGIIDYQNKYHLKEIMPKMLNSMIHRGPDGEGVYYDSNLAMGMRRLSIIDIENGWQPFYDDNKNIIAFQNGEIYNFKSLKAQLTSKGYVFKTKSDTEVLPYGYLEWGIDGLLNRLDGMFALAIYDKRKNVLHLARDRFGEKPLFFTSQNGQFAYSSNISALTLLNKKILSEIDPIALNYYFALHFVPGDITIFKDIKKLLPGERMEINTKTNQILRERYYVPTPANQRLLFKKKNFFIERLYEVIESRLIADVPVGIFLSGGIDSSIIAVFSSMINKEVNTFSMGFNSEKHDESCYAKELAKNINSNHHHFYFSGADFNRLLQEVAKKMDEPIGDQALLPVYWLSKESSKYVKVVLSGEGADEIFGGYFYYNQFRRKSQIKQLMSILSHKSNQQPLNSLIDNYLITPSGYPLIADRKSRESILDVDYLVNQEFEQYLQLTINKSKNELQRAQIADLLTWLPDDLLVKFDQMTMAHSIEGRAPFLNYQLVEFALGLPENQKINNNMNKVFLQKSMAKFLPQSILHRKKQGFVLPMRKWIREWISNKKGLHEYLNNIQFPYINTSYLFKILQDDLNKGIKRERFWFACMMLFEWYENKLKE